jgi:hypothetical protein
MPTRLVFRCEICGAEPDALTQTSIERQLLHFRFGQWVEAYPARWLIWSGRGPYGPTIYACGDHRGELKTFVRGHYGSIGWHPWSTDTYPCSAPDDMERARKRVRRSRTIGGYG